MANFITTDDLKKGALDQAGELTDRTSDFDTVTLEQINQLYRSILSGSNEFKVDLGEAWEWAKAESPSVLELIAPVETGTVALTRGSTSGTFSSAPAASQKNNWLKPDGRPEFFRIATHTAGGTAFTLDADYTDDTGAALNFKSLKLDYDLRTNIMRLIEPMTVYRSQPLGTDLDARIWSVDKKQFTSDFPFTLIEQNTPTRFTIIREVDGLKTIRFNTFVENTTRVEYDYIPIPNELISKTFVDGDVNTGSEVINITAHGLTNDQPVQFTTTGAIPAGLTVNTDFFVIEASANGFKVSATKGGSAVDITAAAGGGTHTVTNKPLIPVQFRKALMYAGAYFILVMKSDSRADVYLRLTQATLQALVQANRHNKQLASKDRGRLIPREDQIVRKFFGRRLLGNT